MTTDDDGCLKGCLNDNKNDNGNDDDDDENGDNDDDCQIANVVPDKGDMITAQKKFYRRGEAELPKFDLEIWYNTTDSNS
jgi:hypothetical protein